jgi:UDP:flavonoid glycosyltransferase YjiC (YdhE family)
VRQVGSATNFLEPALGPVLQAPVRIAAARRPVTTQVSYASLLNNVGFDDPLELAGRIRAWRDLMRTLRTEIVFADHSPTALVAARTLAIPRTALGNGFLVPPQLAPFPSFRPAMKVGAPLLRDNETQVLATLNAALKLLSLPPLERLQDLFGGARLALLTYRELDHYPGKRPEPYLGNPLLAHGAAPQWADGKGPRLMACVRPSPALPSLMEALAASAARVLVRIGGADAASLARYKRPGLDIAEGPIDLQLAAQACDGFVSYGAHGAVCEFLLAGKPGVLVPDQQEALLLTRRAVGLGAAAGVDRGAAVGPALQRLLEDPVLHAAAQAFAARYAAQDRAAIVPKLVAEGLGAL